MNEEDPLKKFVGWFAKTPLDQIFDMKKMRKGWAKASRAQLIANGMSKKKVAKLEDESAIFWAEEQFRQFVGMGPSREFMEMEFAARNRRKRKRK